MIEKFVHNITKNMVIIMYFAFSVVFEDENEYISSHKVHKNIGLLIQKTMSWKWITKDVYENPAYLPLPYDAAVSKIINNSLKL